MCQFAVLCLAITFLSSCGDILTANRDPQVELLDLFETFFRYQFENNHSAQQQHAKSYFLEIEGEDPSPEFLARFHGHSPSVRKGSEFILERLIKVDGELIKVGSGIKFRIDNYNRFGLSRNYVKIAGGYSEGDLSISWVTYIWWRKKASGCWNTSD